MGTNTVLACVVEHDRVVWDAARITRLGGGVDASGRLGDEAIERTLAALAELTQEARAHGATRVVGVGTSALRDAANRDTFVARARGIVDEFRVVAGDEEAALTFRGALFGLAASNEAMTVVDIGGGSTEIVRGAGNVVSRATSVDVGSVRLTERHAIGDAAPTAAQVAAIRADVTRAMAATPIDPPLVMVAGTATNVAAVSLGRDLAAGAVVPHGEAVSAPALRAAVARLIRATPDERRSTVGVEPGRHDVIVAGALILEHVLDRSGAAAVTISDGGVRFGLALSLL